MDELKAFSFQDYSRHSDEKMIYTYNNGQVAYADENGWVYVTPSRPEIIGILIAAGYKESHNLWVPFSNGEDRPAAYVFLAKIADEESWAYTHQKAKKVADEKGIKPVTLEQKFQIKEISYHTDPDSGIRYEALTMIYLLNETSANVGTYIIVDEKTLVVCDEYGRTFLLKAKSVINDAVNALIAAGYKRTVHPERYVHFSEPALSELGIE